MLARTAVDGASPEAVCMFFYAAPTASRGAGPAGAERGESARGALLRRHTWISSPLPRRSWCTSPRSNISLSHSQSYRAATVRAAISATLPRLNPCISKLAAAETGAALTQHSFVAPFRLFWKHLHRFRRRLPAPRQPRNNLQLTTARSLFATFLGALPDVAAGGSPPWTCQT